jgi:hypothetical protein
MGKVECRGGKVECRGGKVECRGEVIQMSRPFRDGNTTGIAWPAQI